MLRFGVAGAIGFGVDAGVLHLLIGPFAINPYLARLPSFLAAATTTWIVNRYWTFAAQRTPARLREWARYLVAMLGGGAVNYACYASLLATVHPVQRWPALGVAAGSLAGMLVNYLSARGWVFRHRQRHRSG